MEILLSELGLDEIEMDRWIGFDKDWLRNLVIRSKFATG